MSEERTQLERLKRELQVLERAHKTLKAHCTGLQNRLELWDKAGDCSHLTMVASFVGSLPIVTRFIIQQSETLWEHGAAKDGGSEKPVVNRRTSQWRVFILLKTGQNTDQTEDTLKQALIEAFDALKLGPLPSELQNA